MSKVFLCLAIITSCVFSVVAQETLMSDRVLSGTIVTQRFELVPNINITVSTIDGKRETVSDAEGGFSIKIPRENLSVTFSGDNIEPVTRVLAATDDVENLQIKIAYKLSPINESVLIEDNTLSPQIELRNRNIYDNTLFSRDDQLLNTLNAGINVGQHEGGGKSLEVRRFGFNLDHGGVNGGLKILVDNVQQNQGTQGHGQGYLGQLKSLSPELVDGVSIINGPFSAQYGDFSGLGVVQIRQKEQLPQQLTFRLQGGRYDTYRTFLSYSPQIKNVASFVAYEGSRSDGPFISPLRYKRDNFTGNATFNRSDKEAIGFKFNAGRNTFFSSGQIPLDEVAAGNLDRFGAIDPENGGRVYTGIGSLYYRKEFDSGSSFKADAFVSRSLFDLFSNFTFFLNDPIYGDEIQQHDSRLQQGATVQFLRPYKLGNNQSLLTIGGNFLASQINVGLYPSIDRNPNRKLQPENVDFRDNDGNGVDDVLFTSARAKVNNYGGFIQNGLDLFSGHVHIDAGLRFDTFTYNVNEIEQFDENNQTRLINGKQSSTKFQPKLGIAWSPFEKIPATVYFNYGRGIASQDARGVIRNADAPRISTTDFYQAGASYNTKRFSASGDFFLIDNSNQQVYIPDDGTIEFAGRSRSYGVEAKTSARFNRFLSFDAGLTQVINAFFPGEFGTGANSRNRIIIDGAPRRVGNASLNLTEFNGFNLSLRYRTINSYRLDGEDDSIRAAGHDVFDFGGSKRVKRWFDVNFAIDNLFNKRFFETQNFFESRVRPTDDIAARIHATPAYPLTFSFGVTFKLFAKN
ncbi:MAG: TonB-dependent receptor [Pyrinomonadaceae bacterium]|nr:TonB-dependent receptor [Pyrinomonadaceae bacterium]